MPLLHVGAVCLALWSFVLCSTGIVHCRGLWRIADRIAAAAAGGGGGAASAKNCTYPDLISATADELEAGLKDGCFSSVDLVNVCNNISKPRLLAAG